MLNILGVSFLSKTYLVLMNVLLVTVKNGQIMLLMVSTLAAHKPNTGIPQNKHSCHLTKTSSLTLT